MVIFRAGYPAAVDDIRGGGFLLPMNLARLLKQLDTIYEDDYDQDERPAGIVNRVSKYMARAGHSELVRAPVSDVDVTAAKRYIAACIAAIAKPAKPEKPKSSLLTIKQAALEFNISERSLYRLTHLHRKNGRSVRIQRQELADHLDGASDLLD